MINFLGFNLNGSNRINSKTGLSGSYKPLPIPLKKDSFSFSGVSKRNNLEFKTAQEAQDYAENKLGVKADFANNIILSRLIINGLKDLKDAGYKLPKRVSSEYERFKDKPKEEKDGKILEIIPAQIITDEGGTIYFNSKFEWENIEARMAKNFREGRLSSDDSRHLVYHELGHFLHYVLNPELYKQAEKSLMWSDDKELIKKEVGDYASRNFCEFVAEVFSGKFSGKTYSEEIENLYKKWGGKINNKAD